MMTINFEPIGFLHTPFTTLADMPIQPASSNAGEGYAEILPEFEEGLAGLELFSHVILIYFFHQQTKTRLTVTPFLDDAQYGVFATRAPSRPNHIGISIVKLQKIEGLKIYLENLDMLNNTPLLDIKPYVAGFDRVENSDSGWLKNKKISDKHSDERFR